MIIGVIGGSECTDDIKKLAFDLGKGIAEKGYYLVCGGMGGVMESACRGAKSAGGITIGILPGKDKKNSNPYIDIHIITAMNHARNAIITRTADTVVALDGKYGTLSEIGLALAMGKRVIGLKTWEIDGVVHAKSVVEVMGLL